MKRLFLTLIVLCLTAALTGACSRQPDAPTPEPESASSLAYADSLDAVVANGTVVPARHLQLSFQVNGQIKDLAVAMGDPVQAGQVLAQLAGREGLEAAVAAAELAVLDAQQALDQLDENAAMVKARAESDVAAAKKALDDARRRLKNLNYPDLDWYQDQIEKAQDAVSTAREDVALEDIGSLQAALQAARDAQEQFKERLDRVTAAVEACEECDPEGSFTVDGFPQTLDDAQDAYNDASNRVKEIEIQIAQARRGNSQAIEDAQQDLEQSVRDLEAAQRGPKPLDVEIAQANVAVAEAALADAQTRLARLQDGPDPAQLAAAQARLRAARTSLAAARDGLEQGTLRAPCAGTVSAVMLDSGEAAAAGMPVLEVIDALRWRIETTDVGELMIGQVKVGQPALVTVNAFPGEELTGTVVAIAPTAIVQLGDTTYAVTVELEPTSLDLRWGMTAKVNIRTNG